MTQGEVTVPPCTAWHLKQLQTSHALLTSLSLHSPAQLSVRQGCVCKHSPRPVSWTRQKRTRKTGVKRGSLVLFGVPKQHDKQMVLLGSGWHVWCPPPSSFSQPPDLQLQYPRTSKQPHQVRQGSRCPISSSGHLPAMTPRPEDTCHNILQSPPSQTISHLGS